MPDSSTKFVLSYGAGVNSTALMIHLIRNKMPIDYVVFADTSSEVPETYEYLKIAQTYLSRQNIPLVIVRSKSGGLYETCVRRRVIPSQIWRWSTRDKKVVPIRAFYRSLNSPIVQYIGIAYDELERMKDSGIDNVTNQYPLVDEKITREGCIQLIEKEGLPVPARSGCYFCLTPGQYVYTSQGPKLIEQITQKDFVLSHQGQFRKVLRAVVHNYDGKINIITVSGRPCFPLEITPTQPVFTRLDSWNSILSKKDARFGLRNLGWSKASHLKVKANGKHGMELACTVIPTPVIQGGFTKRNMRWQVPFNGGRGELVLQVNEDLMTVIGSYLSEAHVATRAKYGLCGLVFSFGSTNKDEALIFQCVRALKRLGYHSSIYKVGQVNRIVVSSAKLARVFVQEFGRGAANKHLPGWLMQLPKRFQRRCFDAYLGGDASLNKNAVPATKNGWYAVASTVSKPLALSMALVAQTLGFICNLAATEANSTIQGRRVNTKTAYEINVRFQGPRARAKHFNHCVLHPIRSIETINYTGNVYDLDVEGDKTFVTQSGIVHNCPFNNLARWSWLYLEHPELYRKALKLEEKSKHFPKQKLTPLTLRKLEKRFKTGEIPKSAEQEAVPCGGECMV